MRRSRAILLGTLIVGTLDALDAVVFFGLRNGTPPMRVFQSIAAGLLGRASYSGGLHSAALGVVLHYVVAFGIAATYILASLKIPLLTRRWVVSGAIYGVGAYFFMNLVVIPVSAIGPQSLTLSAPFFNGIFIHVLGVGWPTAFLAASIAPSHTN
jgi:uncharacterized membrane protein YagU involved in acid resistance